MNIALLSKSENAYSETFIQNHKKNLPGKVFFYYNGLIPTHLEGHGRLLPKPKSVLAKIWGKFKKPAKVLPVTLLEKSFLDNNIDLVFAEYGHCGAAVAPLCEKLNIPLIVTWLGYEISKEEMLKKYDAPYRRLMATNAKHLVVSNTMVPALLAFGAKPENIFYSPFPPDNIYQKTTPKFTENLALFTGRFVDKKAPYYLILAMKKVVVSLPDAHLIMVGDGVLFDACFHLVSYFNLEKNITFAGVKNLKEIEELMAGASQYVQHSITALSKDSEGTPVAVLEASYAGLPVISTKHAGIPDVISDGETGFLVDENDVDAFAEKMIYLFQNKDIAKKMGTKGKAYISQNFSLKNHIAVIEEAIQSIKKF